jgi:protein-S-isoprenylcysteine O-methyltransferase Ste14
MVDQSRREARQDKDFWEIGLILMSTESTFRAVAIASIALCLPIGLYFRIRSQATRERLDRRKEGILIMVGLRLCGLLGWILFTAYLISPGWVNWSSIKLPAWLRWAGAPLGLLVVPVLLFWTFHSLGKNLTDTVVTRREHTLVTHGPYRWVRHPFYVVLFLWVLSFTLLTANWLLALLGGAALTMLVVRTRIEEAKLIERFGDEYRAYARRTGRFFPLLGQGRQGH